MTSGDAKMSAEERIAQLRAEIAPAVESYHDIRNLMEDHAAAAVAEVTRERDEARARVAELERHRSQLDCQYAGAFGETDGASHCPVERPCQRCTLERERDGAQARVAELEAEVERLRGERHELRGEVHGLTEQLAGAKSEVAHLAKELEVFEDGAREKELEAALRLAIDGMWCECRPRRDDCASCVGRAALAPQAPPAPEK